MSGHCAKSALGSIRFFTFIDWKKVQNILSENILYYISIKGI